MQDGADRLARLARSDPGQVTGTVRLSASQPVACHLLPPLLERLRPELPQVRVELVVSNAVSNLLRREADIALRMMQPAQQTLVARRIGQVTLGVYAHRSHLQRRGAPQAPADLLTHDLIGHDQSDDILRGFAAMGHALTREHFALRTDDLIAYWQLLRAGLGIGFVADDLARTDGEVVRLLPGLRIRPLPLWLVVHREIRTSRRIRAVYDFLAQALPQAL